MGDVVNLRQARKARKRSENEAAAVANRARFGESKAEKTKRSTEAERVAKLLDGARREPDQL